MVNTRLLCVAAASLFVSACSHSPPDTQDYRGTVQGAALGSMWGAGTGAIIGHQLSYAGEGAGVGAALGLVAGAMSGNGVDKLSGQVERQEDELEKIKAHNILAFSELQDIQTRLDVPPPFLKGPFLTSIYFDSDSTNLKAGAVSELEVIANFIKSNPYTRSVSIVGHSDDSGPPDYAQKVAEARARSVMGALTARGVASDILKLESFGSSRPLTSNGTPEGRQLNRRVEIIIH